MKLYTYDWLERNGRLGNQLWQIAATISFAEQNDGIARFKPDWEYRKYFSVPDFFFNDPERVDNEHWLDVVDGGTDYFQDFSHITPIEDLVRLYFKPSQLSVEAMRRVVLPEDPFCAIHVRRGDYLKHPNHFPITSQAFYSAAVDDVHARNPDMPFVVFSDDPDWCEQNPQHFGFTDHDYTVNRGTVRPVEVVERVGEPQDQFDLFAMAQATEHIISNSTFAWWGAWLADAEKVFYPSKWFGRGVPNWENAFDCIPPDERWVKKSC